MLMRTVLAAIIALVCSIGSGAHAQSCTGDCSGDGSVTINELVLMVNVALGDAPVSTCAVADANSDDIVAINELVSAVAFALQGAEIEATGTCQIPNPNGTEPPLVHCDRGTRVRIWRCDDLDACLTDPAKRTLIDEEREVGSEGTFSFTDITECGGGSAAYLFEADIGADPYRVIDFGEVHSGEGGSALRSIVLEAAVGPDSEAAVRLVGDGLRNFGGETFSDLLTAVRQAFDPASLGGLDPLTAAALVTETAEEDAEVQRVLTTVLRHDIAVEATIGSQGNLDLYKFTLHAQTPIALQIARTTGELAPCLRVVNPDDERVDHTACGSDVARLDLLLPAGTYYLYVEDQNRTAIGSYFLFYLRLTRSDAEPLDSDPRFEEIRPAGDLDLYGFTLSECSQVTLQATSEDDGFSPCLALRTLGSSAPLAGGSACTGQSSERIELRLAPATYLLLVGDHGGEDAGSYNLQLVSFPASRCDGSSTETPTATPTLTRTPTSAATVTSTPSTMPTATASATPQATSSPTRTQTTVPTATHSPTATVPTPTATQSGTGPAVLFIDDFEASDFWDRWAVNNGTWQWGEPTSGPGGAHQGSKLIATVLDGSYSDDTASRLERLGKFVVPDAAAAPRLRFWHWYSFSCDDFGEVQIKVDGGGWATLTTFSGQSGSTWAYPAIDLSAYAGQRVQLGLYFFSRNSGCNGSPVDVSSGWYIDEVQVRAQP